MSTSAAKHYDETETNQPFGGLAVNARFKNAATAPQPTVLHSENINQTAANQGNFTEGEDSAESANTETDAPIYNPYDKTLQQRVFEKIATGAHGEALDLLFKHLENYDDEYTKETLEHFRDEFESRGLNDLAAHLDKIMNFEIPMTDLLSFSDLGMDIEFFNTGPNSYGNVGEPDVKINRHAIEMHFENEIHKPPQFVQPFLGISYG